jgi:hypothetical protein
MRGLEGGHLAVLALALILAGLTGCANTTVPSPQSTAVSDASPSSSIPVYAGPSEEYLPLIAACLREAGWNAEINQADGGLVIESLTSQQRPALMEARSACEQQIGAPPPPEPASAEQIHERYAFLVQARQCLMALGYTISEPPTEETFADSYATGPWSPFNEVADQATTQQAWNEANDKCPQA